MITLASLFTGIFSSSESVQEIRHDDTVEIELVTAVPLGFVSF